MAPRKNPEHREWYEKICAPQFESMTLGLKGLRTDLNTRLELHEIQINSEIVKNRTAIVDLKDSIHNGWEDLLKATTENLREEFKDSLKGLMRYVSKLDNRLWVLLTVSGVATLGVIVALFVEIIRRKP